MSAVQFLYGYKLWHNDGSEGVWTFADNAGYLRMTIRTKEGVRYVFEGFDEQLERWARTRELNISSAVWRFIPDSLTFEIYNGE